MPLADNYFVHIIQASRRNNSCGVCVKKFVEWIYVGKV